MDRCLPSIDTYRVPQLPSRILDRSSNATEERELYETHVPAKSPPPSAHPRISRADEHESRTPRPEAAPRQGPEAPCRFLTIAIPLSSGRRLVAAGGASGLPRGVGFKLVAQTLRRGERIRRRPEYQRIHQSGVRTHGRYLTLLTLPNDLPVSRLGIAASRRLGGAVRRNRAKRLVRELFRRVNTGSGIDVVVLPRPELLTAKFGHLEADFRSVLSRSTRRR